VILLAACAHRPGAGKAPGESATDTAETGRETAETAAKPTETAETGLDAPCEGADWLDAPVWSEVATLADDDEPRFAGALVAAGNEVWVVSHRLDADYGDGELELYRLDADGLEQVGIVEHESKVPFAYGAAADGAGGVVFGGAWYTATSGTRELLVARFDGTELRVLTTDEPALTGERVEAFVAEGRDAWAVGYGTDGDGTAVGAVWEVGGDLTAAWAPDGGGAAFTAGLAAGGAVLTGGRASDGGEWRPVTWVDGEVQLDVPAGTESAQVEAMAGHDDVVLAAVAGSANDGPGWRVFVDGAEVDDVEGSAGPASAAWHGAGRWAVGGWQSLDGVEAPLVRLGGDSWATVLEGSDPAWNARIHDVAVDGDGAVWLATTERSTDASAPYRSRILRGWCR
jgi:hypothetical protein